MILYKLRFKFALSVMKFLTPNVGINFEKMYRGGTPEIINNVPRPMIKYIAELKQKSLVGAEVGVGDGGNTESIFQTLDMKRLYAVDPYPIPGNAKTTALLVLKDKPVLWHIERSLDAAKKIIEKLDFVYIDALHDYKSVSEDIAAWFPLVREGGVVGGHDFALQGDGVIDAVTEFAIDKNLYLNIAYPDWWLVKK